MQKWLNEWVGALPHQLQKLVVNAWGATACVGVLVSWPYALVSIMWMTFLHLALLDAVAEQRQGMLQLAENR